MRKVIVFLLLSLCMVGTTHAAEMVFEASASVPMEEAYDRVYKALEERRLWVVFEANIGKNLSGFAERWGKDYNQQGLEGIRSMVFCNGWYANRVSNLDPAMLALCPQRLTIIHKQGRSTVLFVRPSKIAGDSPAKSVLAELEEEVIAAIREALK
jgi:uncharacterized protein (DUF302 family)